MLFRFKASFCHRFGMQPGVTCNRCKEERTPPGESWCIGCSAWEGLGRELAGHWDHSGCRVIATDIIVNCVRQVRALRSFGAGLSRAPAEAGTSRASADELGRRSADPRPTLPRKPPQRASTTKKEISPEEDEEESFQEEGEEEDEAPAPHHKPLPGGDRRPPEPPFPPPGRRQSVRGDKETGKRDHRERSRSRQRRTHHREERHHHRQYKPKKKRAGRKHQRLHRLAGNPLLRVHRKPTGAFWTLASEAGRAHLDRPIL